MEEVCKRYGRKDCQIYCHISIACFKYRTKRVFAVEIYLSGEMNDESTTNKLIKVLEINSSLKDLMFNPDS